MPFMTYVFTEGLPLCQVSRWAQGKNGDQTLSLPSRISQSSKKGRQEEAQGSNRSTREGVRGGLGGSHWALPPVHECSRAESGSQPIFHTSEEMCFINK